LKTREEKDVEWVSKVRNFLLVLEKATQNILQMESSKADPEKWFT
jgi:hypothetical protein